jgi:acid phosphatase (class A)
MQKNLPKMTGIVVSQAVGVADLKLYHFKKKSIVMKTIFFVAAAAIAGSAVFSQTNKQVPPAWGHYKKLAAFKGKPVSGKQALDTFYFTLATGDTKVINVYEPAELIANGRKREPFYLTAAEKFSIEAPPANSAVQTQQELKYLLQLQAQRSDEDKRAAAFYATVYYKTSVKPGDTDYATFQRNLFHIGRSIGTWFNADSLPLTAKLIASVWKDAEYYMWKYKNYFLRIRPYKIEPALKNLEETDWAAYPSGHATNSYVNAYLYSKLLPEFSSFFIKDAYDMAHSREIIGVHYPSDSESGRVLAYELVQRLFTIEKFKTDFTAAKVEIEKIKITKGF